MRGQRSRAFRIRRLLGLADLIVWTGPTAITDGELSGYCRRP
jgi:hypothetical protein